MKSYVRNAEGKEGQFNIAWVLWGRPESVSQEFFDRNVDVWYLAGRVCKMEIDGIPVGEYATLLTPAEFYQFIKKHKKEFGDHLAMAKWSRRFNCYASV